LDGDGSDDLVVNPYAPDIGGAGRIQHLELARYPDTVYSFAAAGDTDGDGRDDLAVSATAGVQVFRRGLPPVAVADVELVAAPPSFVTVASVGDVDHDGSADLAAVWP